MSDAAPVFDDEHDAKARAELELKERITGAKEAARDRVRAQFPEVTEFADSVRTQFGEGVRILWAVEGSQSVGRVPQHELESFHERGIDVHPLRFNDPDHSH